MSDIQRWAMSSVHGHTDDGGEWVTYADHLATVQAEAQRVNDSWREHYREQVAQAEQRVEFFVIPNAWNAGYAQGQRDALAKLDALDECYQQDNDWSNGWHEALKALRPIKGDNEPFEGYPPDSGTPMEWTEASDE